MKAEEKIIDKVIVPFCFELKRDCIQRRCPYWKVIRKGKWGETSFKYDAIEECVHTMTERVFLGRKETKIYRVVERKTIKIFSIVYDYFGRCGKFKDQKDYYLGYEGVVLSPDNTCEYIEFPERIFFWNGYYKTHPETQGIKSISEEEISDNEYCELLIQGLLLV